MLSHLLIKNYALIAHVALDLSSGMTVLTGETGAGKSMLTGALKLALGDKADATRIRPEADTCTVEATFQIEPENPIRALLNEWDIELEGNELVLRRSIARDARSKAFANGMRITQDQMAELGENLVDLHGQHDQQKLRQPRFHSWLLDSYAGQIPQRNAMAQAYRTWQETLRELEALRTGQQNHAYEQDLLQSHIGELTAINYQAGEEDELADERKRLMSAEQIISALTLASEAIDADQGALNNLGMAARSLNDVAEKGGETLAPLNDTLQNIYAELGELSRDLGRQLSSFQPDPDRLAQVDERLSTLHDLARKHHTTIAELPNKLAELERKLSGLDNAEANLAALEKAVTKAEADYKSIAEKISENRQKFGAKLKTEIEAALANLSLRDTEFKTSIEPKLPAEWNSDGMDKVEFLIKPNPGLPFAPLAATASGGELSRILLALKQVFYTNISPMTIIFDEIDTGIGGAVASQVGQSLKNMAQAHQIIAISHQPQVAALAQQHLFISKSVADNQTSTSVKPLVNDDKIDELARMLAGQNVTAEAKAAAISLLQGH